MALTEEEVVEYIREKWLLVHKVPVKPDTHGLWYLVPPNGDRKQRKNLSYEIPEALLNAGLIERSQGLDYLVNTQEGDQYILT